MSISPLQPDFSPTNSLFSLESFFLPQLENVWTQPHNHLGVYFHTLANGYSINHCARVAKLARPRLLHAPFPETTSASFIGGWETGLSMIMVIAIDHVSQLPELSVSLPSYMNGGYIRLIEDTDTCSKNFQYLASEGRYIGRLSRNASFSSSESDMYQPGLSVKKFNL